MKAVWATIGLVAVLAGYLIWRQRGNTQPPATPEPPPSQPEAPEPPAQPPTLEQQVRDAVAPLARPATALLPSKEPTKSYLGGLPPAHKGFEWPTDDGRPLTFIACLDLADVRNVDWLPKQGVLLFFYDYEEQNPYASSDDGCRVLYVPKSSLTTSDEPAPEKLDEDDRLDKRFVRAKPISSPPSWSLAPLHIPGEQDDDSDRKWDLLNELRGESFEGDRHQIGGFADAIQQVDMYRACELMTAGKEYHFRMADEDPRVELQNADKSDWRLLLQVDSDDDLDAMFGDAGMIYFWVERSRAAKGDFSNVWCILQCM